MRQRRGRRTRKEKNKAFSRNEMKNNKSGGVGGALGKKGNTHEKRTRAGRPPPSNPRSFWHTQVYGVQFLRDLLRERSGDVRVRLGRLSRLGRIARLAQQTAGLLAERRLFAHSSLFVSLVADLRLSRWCLVGVPKWILCSDRIVWRCTRETSSFEEARDQLCQKATKGSAQRLV